MTDADKWRAFLTYIAPERKPLKIDDGSVTRRRIRWVLAIGFSAAILGWGAVSLNTCHRRMAQQGIVSR